jgi:hypothetical protein
MGSSRDPQGRLLNPVMHDVIWVSFHQSYMKAEREYDVAVLGLKWSLQFSHTLAPICLPDPQSSDTNNRKKESSNNLLSLKSRFLEF